jgi:hypothetical protein
MIVLIVSYDFFIFELTSIKLGGHTCLKGFFDFILDFMFLFFTLEHEAFSFNQLS